MTKLTLREFLSVMWGGERAYARLLLWLLPSLSMDFGLADWDGVQALEIFDEGTNTPIGLVYEHELGRLEELMEATWCRLGFPINYLPVFMRLYPADIQWTAYSYNARIANIQFWLDELITIYGISADPKNTITSELLLNALEN